MDRSTWIQTIKEVRLSFILSPNVPLHPRLADVVWSEQKQIGLIDSVFRNYYIPPIIFGEPSISTPSLIKPLKSPQ